MLLKHKLDLEIPETSCENVLRIIDVSDYADTNLLPITCERLDIIIPGYTNPVYINTINYNFSLNLTAQDLEIICESDTGSYPLPDGVYDIRYSICPEETANVSYYHLRTTAITNQYYKELCKLNFQECEPTAELLQKIKDLRYIKMLIEAAKAKAEYCQAPDKGMQMYNYAKKLLSKYKTGCCVTCK